MHSPLTNQLSLVCSLCLLLLSPHIITTLFVVHLCHLFVWQKTMQPHTFVFQFFFETEFHIFSSFYQLHSYVLQVSHQGVSACHLMNLNQFMPMLTFYGTR